MEEILFSPDPSKFSSRFVGPKGSMNPYLYIVGEAPGRDEDEQLLPFVGQSGQLLDKALVKTELDVLQIRFWNAIPYRPISENSNRTPEPEEIKLYSQFVLQDIRKRKPKVIVVSGRSAMSVFGIDMAVGASRAYRYEFEGIPVFTTWHPSYALRQGGEVSPAFTDIVNDIKRAWKSDPIRAPSESEFEIIDVTEWDRVERILSNETDVGLKLIPANGLDYEASGLSQYHKNFYLGGIALGGVNTNKVFYVKIYDFWRNPNEWEFPEELKERIGNWLESKKLIVFNGQYEYGVTLTIFKKYLRNVIDILMWNRMLGYKGGLKDVAAKRLNIIKWNSEVEVWNDLVQILFNRCKSMRRIDKATGLYKFYPKGEILFILEGIPDKNIPIPTTLEEIINWIASTPEIEANLGTRDKLLYETFTKLNVLISKYFSGDKKLEFTKRFFKLLTDRALARETDIRFTDIPIEIIGPYASDDVKYTCDLFLDFKKEIMEKDLIRAADIYNCHGKLGFELESAGIAWDDKKAEELNKLYSVAAVDNLRNIIVSKKFSEILGLSQSDIIKIQSTLSLDVLIEYFNPRSTHENTRKNLSRLMITGRVKMARMLYEIFKEWSHRPVEQARNQFPVLYPMIEEIISKTDYKDKIETLDLMVENSEAIAKKIQSHSGNHFDKWRNKRGDKITPPEIDIYITYSKWEFDNLGTEIFEELYMSYEAIMGIKIDEPDTWTEEFQYLMWFRMYKKVMKSLSSYIWGNMGRGTICQIDKNITTLNQDRVLGWQEEIPNNKIWIQETEWGVGTAATKRWRSGTHTVPWNSELMDCRTSRFDDGIRIHYDYSQNEVRMLARMSKDRKMMQAFEDGRDIHRFVASQVWRKPEEEVLDVERRFAKMSTFSIVYGDTPSGFAAKFMHGDVTAAEKIFSGFYSQFPEVDLWIKQTHREGIFTGYVHTMFGDTIWIDMPSEVLNLSPDHKEALLLDLFTKEVFFSDDFRYDTRMRFDIAKAWRNCQNYPIQSTSSTLAGLGMYYMADYARTNNMRARFDCFTHDSGDMDTPLNEVPRILNVLPSNSMGRIKEEFDVPLMTEFEIGVSGDSTIELDNLVVDKNFIRAHFSGKKSSLDKLNAKFEKYNVKSNFKISSSKVETKSLKELFMHKRAFAMSIGTSYETVKGEIELDFSNVRKG
jgi:uracil-DNA glycosylase family 4